MTTKQELTRAELEVMQILWRTDNAFVNDILEEMPDPRPAYNTVSTIVRILEKKGVVGHEAFGKSHRYRPLIGKEEYTRNFMQGVMHNFFDNSFTQLFSFFSASENLSTAEIEEIRRIAEQIARQNK
ncbi:MAG: BlaI/MecI/CopY family transcriptional regulator [Rikenellaceae bacterium]|jgi:predicted transcriptional regulator|nr:BlaI/MecI/CopY family transcriptional regulator [Rikenellaceae bacterium]